MLIGITFQMGRHSWAHLLVCTAEGKKYFLLNIHLSGWKRALAINWTRTCNSLEAVNIAPTLNRISVCFWIPLPTDGVGY